MGMPEAQPETGTDADLPFFIFDVVIFVATADADAVDIVLGRWQCCSFCGCGPSLLQTKRIVFAICLFYDAATAADIARRRSGGHRKTTSTSTSISTTILI